MKKTKLFGVIAVLGISLAGLVACGDKGNTDNPGGGTENPGGETPAGKTINLVMSGPGEREDLDKRLIEGFKEWRKAEGDPNTYNVEWVLHGEDKVDSEITDWAQGPDVYAYASDKVQTLFSKGALAKLSGTYEDFVLENNNPVGIASATFNDGIYAFPFSGDNTYYITYDKSVFTAEDVASVENIIAKCKETGTQFAYPLGTAFYGGAALFTFGADYTISFTEDGQVRSLEADFNGENGLQAAKGMLSIVNSGVWMDQADVIPGQNNCSVSVLGTWKIADAKAALGENYGIAPMPTITVDGETANLGAFCGGKLYGVNPQRSGTDTDRLNGAYLLGQYLSGAEASELRFDELGIGPSNSEVYNLDKVKNNENMVVLSQQTEFAHAQTAVPGGFWTSPEVLVDGMQDGTVTEATLQEALDVLNDSIESSR